MKDIFLEDGITTEVVDGCLVISGVQRATVRVGDVVVEIPPPRGIVEDGE